MAETTPVSVQRLDTSILPTNIFSRAYTLYLIQQNTDLTSVAGQASESAGAAAQANARNVIQDQQITSLNGRVAALTTRVLALEVYNLRPKSEVVYSGISLTIPTVATNFLTLLSTLTPSSGSLLPFFDVSSGRLVARNKNKDLNFKASIRGTYTSASGNRSMQIVFGTTVTDTIVVSRDAAVTTDDVFINTFFAVEENDNIVSPGITMMINANGSAFTATQIKIIATQ